MDRVSGGEDSDTSTARTVALMGDYIRKCSTDTAVVGAAEYARKHFASGMDAAGLCWGVFWYVKHCVKFRQDEATMFRLGMRDEVDFLTAPDVLLRMNDPAEDCDGFTMLVASMLTALGVPVAIATVAASPEDPARWSHVFALALLPGRVLPLDASHGVGPGWRVPEQHTFRFQAWDLFGKPIDVKLPRRSDLHGYQGRGRGRAGLGDVCYDPAGRPYYCYPPGTPAWAAAAPAVANDVANLTGIFAGTPVGTVYNPQAGAYLDAAGVPVAGPYGSYGGYGAPGFIPPVVLWGGLLLLGFVMFSGKR
jgi:hypothetical protein